MLSRSVLPEEHVFLKALRGERGSMQVSVPHAGKGNEVVVQVSAAPIEMDGRIVGAVAVDTDITLADLQGTLLTFARAIFGDERQVRMRPHYFPFTEPSVEVDVSCFNCKDGVTADGERCPLCKGTAWIEILGAGMVDPNVFEYVREYGYDPEKVQGFAFGMGIERIAMLKHEVPDLRLFYDNDLRFVEQFG